MSNGDRKKPIKLHFHARRFTEHLNWQGYCLWINVKSIRGARAIRAFRSSHLPQAMKYSSNSSIFIKLQHLDTSLGAFFKLQFLFNQRRLLLSHFFKNLSLFQALASSSSRIIFLLYQAWSISEDSTFFAVESYQVLFISSKSLNASDIPHIYYISYLSTFLNIPKHLTKIFLHFPFIWYFIFSEMIFSKKNLGSIIFACLILSCKSRAITWPQTQQERYQPGVLK